MTNIYLAIWAATIPILPWALWRKKYDLFNNAFILFGALLIPILIGIQTPNPDMIRVIAVVAP